MRYGSNDQGCGAASGGFAVDGLPRAQSKGRHFGGDKAENRVRNGAAQIRPQRHRPQLCQRFGPRDFPGDRHLGRHGLRQQFLQQYRLRHRDCRAPERLQSHHHQRRGGVRRHFLRRAADRRKKGRRRGAANLPGDGRAAAQNRRLKRAVCHPRTLGGGRRGGQLGRYQQCAGRPQSRQAPAGAGISEDRLPFGRRSGGLQSGSHRGLSPRACRKSSVRSGRRHPPRSADRRERHGLRPGVFAGQRRARCRHLQRRPVGAGRTAGRAAAGTAGAGAVRHHQL